MFLLINPPQRCLATLVERSISIVTIVDLKKPTNIYLFTVRVVCFVFGAAIRGFDPVKVRTKSVIY